MWLSEMVTKYFKEVNIDKSRKKLQPSISEDSKCYIFLKSSEQLWLKLKGFKVFQGGCTGEQSTNGLKNMHHSLFPYLYLSKTDEYLYFFIVHAKHFLSLVD